MEKDTLPDSFHHMEAAGHVLDKSDEFIHPLYDAGSAPKRETDLRQFIEASTHGHLVVFKDGTCSDSDIAREKIRKKVMSFLFVNISPCVTSVIQKGA